MGLKLALLKCGVVVTYTTTKYNRSSEYVLYVVQTDIILSFVSLRSD